VLLIELLLAPTVQNPAETDEQTDKSIRITKYSTKSADLRNNDYEASGKKGITPNNLNKSILSIYEEISKGLGGLIIGYLTIFYQLQRLFLAFKIMNGRSRIG
jgi:hypothetical protein